MRFVNDEDFLKSPLIYLRNSWENPPNSLHWIKGVFSIPLQTNRTRPVDVSRVPSKYLVWIPLQAETGVMQQRIDDLIPQASERLYATSGMGITDATLFQRTSKEFQDTSLVPSGELIEYMGCKWVVYRVVNRRSDPILMPLSIWRPSWTERELSADSKATIYLS